MKNWFESWFDTKYYHILYKNRDYNEAEFFIKNLVKSIEKPLGSKVLDLACGKGRHALFLNKLGFDVTGVDLSPKSIQSAKFLENKSLCFYTHDMRDPIQNQKFDVIFNLFTSIGYFENKTDNITMLSSIHSYMNDDGLLIIDFLNQKKVIKNLIPLEKKNLEDIEFTIEKALVNGFIEKTITFNDNSKDYKFIEKVQAISLEDFKQYLKSSGFYIKKLFGEYDLSPFDIDKSNRLIIFAKKK